MGCLNAGEGFSHWFGNIHLSGPCNRKCYFCIGQHMMALDALNNLDKWPLKNIEKFAEECVNHGVSEVNATGSNTDPLLYRHTADLKAYLKGYIPNLRFGLRTNGALISRNPEIVRLYDKLSITICSFDPEIYLKMMGQGTPPDMKEVFRVIDNRPVKVNVVLGPENVRTGDVFKTLTLLSELGIEKVNIREPYGQPHVGNPLESFQPASSVYGMPIYNWLGTEVTYWDVHYVEVESVNLYANGEVSILYPVSKGHCPETGKVLGQENFNNSGRLVKQWQYKAA